MRPARRPTTSVTRVPQASEARRGLFELSGYVQRPPHDHAHPAQPFLKSSIAARSDFSVSSVIFRSFSIAIWISGWLLSM